MPSIDDLEPGDIIQFKYPESIKKQAGKFGVGILLRIIKRRKGRGIDIELESSMGKKILIREDYIDWGRTMHFNLKKFPSKKEGMN